MGWWQIVPKPTDRQLIGLANDGVFDAFVATRLQDEFDRLINTTPDGTVEWAETTLERVRQMSCFARLRDDLHAEAEEARKRTAKNG